jgi:hypothetical protein
MLHARRASLYHPAMPRAKATISSVASLTLASALLLLGGCQHPTAAQYDAEHGWSVFGTLTPTVRGETPEVTAANAAEYANTGQLVALSGTVSDVCRTMGCWIEVENDTAQDRNARILVMSKDHAFFVPRNCRGRRVHATGQVVVETQSVEMRKHLAMDAGKSQMEIDAITEPSTVVIFVADAIILPGGGLEKPVEPLPAEQEIAPIPDTSMTPPADAAPQQGAQQ